MEGNSHFFRYALFFLLILRRPSRTVYPPSLLNFQTRDASTTPRGSSPASTTAMWFEEGTCHGVIPAGLRVFTFRHADAVEGTRTASYESLLQRYYPRDDSPGVEGSSAEGTPSKLLSLSRVEWRDASIPLTSGRERAGWHTLLGKSHDWALLTQLTSEAPAA